MIDAAGRHPRLSFGILSTALLLAAIVSHLMVSPYLIALYDQLKLPLPAMTLRRVAMGTPGLWISAALALLGIAAGSTAKNGRYFPALPYMIFGIAMLFFLGCWFALVLPFCSVSGH